MSGARRYACVSRQIPWRLADIARWVRASGVDAVWLDSAAGHSELGTRSLLTLELRPVAHVGREALFVAAADGRLTALVHRGRPFELLDSIWRRYRARTAPESPGWVGYAAYEAMHFADDALPFVEIPFAAIRWDRIAAALVEDETGTRLVVEAPEADVRASLDAWMQRLEACAAADAVAEPDPPLAGAGLRPTAPPRAWHAERVDRILEHIRDGRIYQACLTFPLHVPRPHDMGRVYEALREANPGDQGVWMRLGEVELASVSPERLLRIERGRAIVRPMKGTRDRGEGEEGGEALRESTKDRAENVMIVDLLRNDLGRICEPGSVHVPALFEVEPYRTVYQMTSTVEGTLRAGVGPFEALAAVFPPGSMTGAPRVEACRVLEELEQGPRGLYAGTVGWVRPSGDADFNVVIRGLQAWGETARWDVGGGIVQDSTAEGEWREAWAKAAPLLRVLGVAGPGHGAGPAE